jgi:hypothetical protein
MGGRSRFHVADRGIVLTVAAWRYRLATLLLLLAAGCGAAPEVAAPPASGIRDVDAVEDFIADFDADVGVPRAILLLSPT